MCGNGGKVLRGWWREGDGMGFKGEKVSEVGKDDVFDLGGVVRPVANRVFHAPDFVTASLENGG